MKYIVVVYDEFYVVDLREKIVKDGFKMWWGFLKCFFSIKYGTFCAVVRLSKTLKFRFLKTRIFE